MGPDSYNAATMFDTEEEVEDTTKTKRISQAASSTGTILLVLIVAVLAVSFLGGAGYVLFKTYYLKKGGVRVKKGSHNTKNFCTTSSLCRPVFVE